MVSLNAYLLHGVFAINHWIHPTGKKNHENEKKKDHIGNSQNNSKDFTLITHPASMPATIAQPISLYSSGVELPKATPWIEASGNIK